MTRISRVRRAASLTLVAVLVCAWMATAGDLNPPLGPIAPTMKTLDEVEPRIAVNATNTPGDADSLFRITQPGSYYLTGNVTGQSGMHGIQIDSEGVTLDLSGFTLIGVTGSLDGINMPTFRENVVICNGHTRGWGASGIESRIDIGRIERVTAADNGAWGIDSAPVGSFNTHITCCEATDNGGLVAGTGGIRGGASSAITDCVSYNNTGDGISASTGTVIERAVAVLNTSDGISCSGASTIRSCTARNSGASGISCGAGSLIESCSSNANTIDGIVVNSDCVIRGNTCDSNGLDPGDGAGIHITGSDNRIEGNLCTDCDRGIDVDAGGNFIARNTCSGNTTNNWDIVAGNVCLVVSATTAGAITGNSGGTAPGSTDPNANFTY